MYIFIYIYEDAGVYRILRKFQLCKSVTSAVGATSIPGYLPDG